MLEVPKVNDITVLLDKLGWVGTIKLSMPFTRRWWLNEVGLHVQLRYAAGQGFLQAGGKYKSYFIAWGKENEYISLWKVKKHDKETWNRRFSHLVWPTYEIALFIGGAMIWDMPVTLGGNEIGRVKELDDVTFKIVGEQAGKKIKQAINHFRATGEWLGLIEWRCKHCSQRLEIWQLQDELCPYCSGKLRE